MTVQKYLLSSGGPSDFIIRSLTIDGVFLKLGTKGEKFAKKFSHAISAGFPLKRFIIFYRLSE